MKPLFDEFLFSGLHSEIVLCECDSFFSRIAILSQQIASITGKDNILNFTFGPRPYLDHFREVTKMVVNFMAAGGTRAFSPLNGRGKIFPPFVTQEGLEIAGRPESQAILSSVRSAFKTLPKTF